MIFDILGEISLLLPLLPLHLGLGVACDKARATMEGNDRCFLFWLLPPDTRLKLLLLMSALDRITADITISAIS